MYKRAPHWLSGCIIIASFATTFLKHYGRGEGLVTTACLKIAVGGKQGHAPCKILLPIQIRFSCHSHFIEITRVSQR